MYVFSFHSGEREREVAEGGGVYLSGREDDGRVDIDRAVEGTCYMRERGNERRDDRR